MNESVKQNTMVNSGDGYIDNFENNNPYDMFRMG